MTPKIVAAPVLQVRTVHYIEVSWTWPVSHLQDTDHHEAVWVAVESEGRRLCEKYGVEFDFDYRTTYEGIQLKGHDLDRLKAAGLELLQIVAQQEHIEFLDWVEEAAA